MYDHTQIILIVYSYLPVFCYDEPVLIVISNKRNLIKIYFFLTEADFFLLFLLFFSPIKSPSELEREPVRHNLNAA